MAAMDARAMDVLVRERRRRFPDAAAARREEAARAAGLSVEQRLVHLFDLVAFGAACAARWPKPDAARRLAAQIEEEGNRRLRDWARTHR